jgi:hypothetical protein
MNGAVRSCHNPAKKPVLENDDGPEVVSPPISLARSEGEEPFGVVRQIAASQSLPKVCRYAGPSQRTELAGTRTGGRPPLEREDSP